MRKRTLALLRELAERKKAEASLAEREQDYRDIFNTTSDALFILDPGGQILDVNQTMCAMYDYQRDNRIEALPGGPEFGDGSLFSG